VTTLFYQIYAFAMGAGIGSFLNVCILRWPRERSVVRPRSRCSTCGHQLEWFENIPVLSWVVLKAMCRVCEEPISIQYPLIELAVATGWVLAVNAFGPSFTAIRVAIFGTILLGIAVTDLREYLIPDGFTLSGLVFVLVAGAVAFVRGDGSPFATPYDAIIGACAGAGMIAIIGWIGEIALGKEAMGLGDVTLMAFVGAALGPQRAITTVFLGAVLGMVA
jgi:leader peptidase (prepilin peptidase)/N-methyltransferase